MTAYKVMTLNLKTDLPMTHGDSLFENRAGSIEAMIQYYDPDWIGVQELCDSMIPLLPRLSDRYVFYGRARNRSSSFADERCCILYRKDRFEMLKGETFWLSAYPEVSGSRSGGSIYPRIATLAVLRDLKTDTVFTACNTHLDHLIPAVRFHQCEVLRLHLQQKKQGEFLTLTGDFNATSRSAAVRLLVSDQNPLQTVDASEDSLGPTMRSPHPDLLHDELPIDHIFLSRSLHII